MEVLIVHGHDKTAAAFVHIVKFFSENMLAEWMKEEWDSEQWIYSISNAVYYSLSMCTLSMHISSFNLHYFLNLLNMYKKPHVDISQDLINPAFILFYLSHYDYSISLFYGIPNISWLNVTGWVISTPVSYPESPKFYSQPGDSYLDWAFLQFSFVLPGTCWSSILIQTTSASASFPVHRLKSPSQLMLHNLCRWEEQKFTYYDMLFVDAAS